MFGKVIRYMFGRRGRTMYCVRLCRGTYVSAVMKWKPYVRKTVSDKAASFWMSKPEAEDCFGKALEMGYFDAKIVKVRWWDVLRRA